MNCLEFRQLKLADPYSTVAKANAHKDECENCQRFEAEIRALDQKTRQALSIAVPENLAAKILLKQSLQRETRRPTRLYWLGMAASLFLAVGIFVFRPVVATALETEIAAHMDHEKEELAMTKTEVDQSRIDEVMDRIDTEFTSQPEHIYLAKTCVIDGRLVAHLVIEDEGKQYTILVMPEIPADDSSDFELGDWNGIVLPQSFGSVAVVGGPSASSSLVEEKGRKYAEAFRQTDA